jgi:hypothetical protein
VPVSVAARPERLDNVAVTTPGVWLLLHRFSMCVEAEGVPM